jgi:phytoene dehydrogenase-like protein
MKEIALSDGAAIDVYIQALRGLLPVELFGLPMAKPKELLKLLPHLPAMVKWARITLDQYAQRFNDPFLQRAFPLIQYGFAQVPMLIHLNFMAGCHNKTLAWPTGGSRPFSAAIAQRYESLGGQVHYRSPVAEILVEQGPRGDRAAGVRLADGSEHAADVVISAADGHATLFEMLGGRYNDARVEAYYANVPDRQDMNMHVCFGVDRDMSAEPHALCLLLDEPVELLGKARNHLSVEVYGFDPSMAPKGKAVVKVLLDARYSHWKALYGGERERYKAAKQEVAAQVLALLEARFPGLAGQVEVVDVATPVTVERFTGNYHGSQAWLDEDSGMLDLLQSRTRSLPGLDRFYMAGQWAGGIGLSTSAIQGRKAIEVICKQDGQAFVSKVP